MIPQDSMLVRLVKLIDQIPTRPVGPAKRGCPLTHPEGPVIKGPLMGLEVVTREDPNLCCPVLLIVETIRRNLSAHSGQGVRKSDWCIW